jgi:hypothetical protein
MEVNFDEGKLRLLRDYIPPASTSILKPGGRLKGWTYVPMDLGASGLPFVRMEIGGVSIKAIIDTGALSCIQLRKETFDRLVSRGTIAPAPDSENIKSADAGGIATNRTGKFTSGNVLGIDLNGTPVADCKAVNILGLRFLQHFNFVCDLAGRRLCLQQRHAEPPINPYEMIGAGFIYTEGHCRVFDIAESGPAYEAGLRKDDDILKFGSLQEKNLNRLSEYEICETCAGQTIDVEYSRAGKEQVLKARLKLRKKRFLFPPQP